MKLKTFITMIWDGRFSLMLKLAKTSEEFYRASFMATGLKEGIFDQIRKGPIRVEELNSFLFSRLSPRTLEAWLELGVKLGELKHKGNGYALGSRFSRMMTDPGNDPQRAFLQEIVDLHHRLITETPPRLKQGIRFTWSDTDGELIARSSRVLEPFVVDSMEHWIPKTGECTLLEVGCGSGIYIRQACLQNPLLKAVGLEMQPEVAAFARKNLLDWKLADRASIESLNILDYETDQKFDLVTLHNNIYYFPEDQRLGLLLRLKSLLKPEGCLIVTTSCRNGGVGMQALNLWVAMTEGTGPLPLPEELHTQLIQAGFQKIKTKNLVLGEKFYQFVAEV